MWEHLRMGEWIPCSVVKDLTYGVYVVSYHVDGIEYQTRGNIFNIRKRPIG